jgi:hypothetical protein
MSRGMVRPVVAGLVLALMLALAVPGEAAGLRGRAQSWSILDFIPRWVVSLFEKSGFSIDPNGSAAPSTDSGFQIDPNG